METKFPRPLDSFAALCGVNKWILYKIENGTKRATSEQAKAIHWAGGPKCWITRPDIWKEGQEPPEPFHRDLPAAS